MASHQGRRVWTAKRRLRPAFIAVATLLAFIFQAFVADTHWHFSDLPSVAAAEIGAFGTASATHRDTVPLAADACSVCTALAGTARILVAVAELPPAANIVADAPRTAGLAEAPARSHSWQGRAPPAARLTMM